MKNTYHPAMRATHMAEPMEAAWVVLKQYDPMAPLHSHAQRLERPNVVGRPYTPPPRRLAPFERTERILADRNQAIDGANQFHQDRIDAQRNLPTPGATQMGEPEDRVENPFTHRSQMTGQPPNDPAFIQQLIAQNKQETNKRAQERKDRD